MPTSLAVFWGDALWRPWRRQGGRRRRAPTYDYMVQHSTPAEQLAALDAARGPADARTSASWKTPWGEINRFQRLTGDIVQPFDDAGASTAVPFTSSAVGLARLVRGASAIRGPSGYYGTSGNSFVAGGRVRAEGARRGGQRPAARAAIRASPHFNDQAERYAAGDLREVYFYPEQLKGHTERSYRPGE